MKLLFWCGMTWLFASAAHASDLQDHMQNELQKHHLRSVESPQALAICHRLHNRFLVIGEEIGYDRISRSVLATSAIHSMTIALTNAQAKSGDFVDIHYLAQIAGLPIPDTDHQYIATAPLFGEALGLAKTPLLILSADDLKYLPYQQMNSEILLITNSTSALNKSRAERVATLAKNLNIRIHTLWTGATPGDLHDGPALPLAWLAAATGGKFVSFTAEACLNKI